MDNKNTETIADTALAGATVPQTGTAAPKSEPTTSKYKPGVYRADKFMRIIKQLSHTHQRDENGKVQKTYGTWATEKNMIIFQKGVEKRLTAEDLALSAVQRLIDSKVIYRVGD